jgi:hypothetical protein
MNQRIRAEYDEESGSLRLLDPLEGIENHQTVVIAIQERLEKSRDSRDWRALRGSLPPEAAEDLRRVLIASRADED